MLHLELLLNYYFQIPIYDFSCESFMNNLSNKYHSASYSPFTRGTINQGINRIE